jgi:NADPH-dependent 2,4-dienoyl-CoA reductase/sulfur reductase-like enzyme
MQPERHDAVVVGAGPAGLVASLHLAEAGASVLLIDEADELGGQYYRQRPPALRAWLGAHRPRGERLVAAVRARGVQVRTSTLVWGADGTTLMTSHVDDGRLAAVAGSTTLLATGGYERSVPFPGWELPGVVTPGCALRLASIDGVAIGRRVIVAGTGPLLLVAACDLLEVGVRDLRVLEYGTGHRFDAHAVEILRHPDRLVQLAGLRARLARHRVRLEHGMRVVAAEGRGRVERAVVAPVARPQETTTISVDALAVGYGLRPATELAQVLGLACRRDRAMPAELVPILDEHGESSVPNVFVAGEAAGVGGAPLAEARGLVAAARMRERLALPGPASTRARRRQARLEAFARFSEARFPPPQELLAAIPDDTLLCRCEAVTAAAVRAAAAVAEDPASVKRITRAGMGVCQGRACAPAVTAIAAASGHPERLASAPQMPVKPIAVPVATLAEDDR